MLTSVPDELRNNGVLDATERSLLSLVSDTVGSRVHRPPQGDDNIVVIVDGRWVIRVPKTDDARAASANEVAALRVLSDRCPVPRPVADHADGVVYGYLPGEELDRDAWLALDPARRRSVARQLRATLDEIHALPTDALPDPLDSLDAGWVRDSIRSCAGMEPRRPLAFDPATLLDRFEAAWLLAHARTAIVHVDLKPTNLLLDDEQVSIIDFGALSFGDPALDYGVLRHHLGEDLLVDMGVAGTPLAARARCYSDLYHLRRCTRGWTRSAPRYSD